MFERNLVSVRLACVVVVQSLCGVREAAQLVTHVAVKAKGVAHCCFGICIGSLGDVGVGVVGVVVVNGWRRRKLCVFKPVQGSRRDVVLGTKDGVWILFQILAVNMVFLVVQIHRRRLGIHGVGRVGGKGGRSLQHGQTDASEREGVYPAVNGRRVVAPVVKNPYQVDHGKYDDACRGGGSTRPVVVDQVVGTVGVVQERHGDGTGEEHPVVFDQVETVEDHHYAHDEQLVDQAPPCKLRKLQVIGDGGDGPTERNDPSDQRDRKRRDGERIAYQV